MRNGQCRSQTFVANRRICWYNCWCRNDANKATYQQLCARRSIPTMPLTDTKCRQCKPGEKLLKLSDGGGLQLHIFPNGSKLWRGAYRYGGKQKTFSMGSYPELSLQDARVAWKSAREQLDTGIDPTKERRLEKLRAASGGKTFEQVATEWRQTKYSVGSRWEMMHCIA